MRKMDWLLKSLFLSHNMKNWLFCSSLFRFFFSLSLSIFTAATSKNHVGARRRENEPHKLNYFCLLQTFNFSTSQHILSWIQAIYKRVKKFTPKVKWTRSYQLAYYRFKIASAHSCDWHSTGMQCVSLSWWWEIFFYLLLFSIALFSPCDSSRRVYSKEEKHLKVE